MASWGARRRLIYLSSVVGFFATIGLVYYVVNIPQPTCFDGVKNQNEVGVDCGGVCTLACQVQLIPVKPLWTQSFESRDNLYDVSSLIENANKSFGARRVSYNIRLVDSNNITIRERAGETYVNPGERFVIFEPSIDVGNRPVKQAFITFDDATVPWERLVTESPQISVSTQPFENGASPRVTVAVTNTSVLNLKDVDLAIVLSDANQNAFAGSSSFIKSLAKGETKDVVFTWPNQFAETPSFVDVYPRVNRFMIK